MIDGAAEDKRARALGLDLRMKLEVEARNRGLQFHTIFITECDFGWRITVELPPASSALWIEYFLDGRGRQVLKTSMGSAQLGLDPAGCVRMFDVFAQRRLSVVAPE